MGSSELGVEVTSLKSFAPLADLKSFEQSRFRPGPLTVRGLTIQGGDDGVAAVGAGDVMIKLSDEDSRAIDMILNAKASARSNGNGNGDGHPPHNGGHATAFVPPSTQFPERLARAARVLDLLKAMPAADPPTDLLARTIDLCNRSPANHPAAPMSGIPALQTRPQA